MTNIYITEQGAHLHKRNEQIVCEKDEETILARPLKDVGMVVIFGNVQVSVQALLALLDNGCDVSLMTQNGHFRGRLVPALGKNSTLRFNQYQACNDPEYRLATSKRIVGAKIHNCIKLLKKYHYSGSNPVRFEGFEKIEGLMEKIENTESLDSLRGYEGAAAQSYFSGFADALTCGIPFPGRKFYPSTDPINAVLSFGYSFVAREIQGLLDAFGLDPYIGFFHEVSYGRASLSLDLLEEYRHFLVDRLTLKLFNKRIIEEEDFDVQEDGGWYLKRDVLKIFIKHYEETVTEPTAIYRGEKRSFRHIFREQVSLLRNAITESTFYEPFRAEE